MNTANGTANGAAHATPNRHEVRRRLQENLASALLAGQYRKARRISESLLLWDDFRR